MRMFLTVFSWRVGGGPHEIGRQDGVSPDQDPAEVQTLNKEVNIEKAYLFR